MCPIFADGRHLGDISYDLSFGKYVDIRNAEIRKFCEIYIVFIFEFVSVTVCKKRNIADALSKWAKNQGYKISDIEDDPRMVRLFIHKSSRGIKV